MTMEPQPEAPAPPETGPVPRLRRGRWALATACAAICFAMAILIVGASRGVSQRDRCGGAYVLVSGGFMQTLHERIVTDLNEGRAVPGALALYLVREPGLADILTHPCACDPRQSAIIGAYTLDDVLQGRVTRETAEQSITPDAASAAWEHIGQFTLCRDPVAHRVFDAALIIGWEQPCDRGWEKRPCPSGNILFADGHVELVRFLHYDEMLNADAAARRKHNIGALPPDEPFTALAARHAQ